MNKLLPLASLALIVGGLQAQTAMDVAADIAVTANAKSAKIDKGAVASSAYASVRDGKSWWRSDASASKSVRHYTSKYSGDSYASVNDSASAAMGTNKADVASGKVNVTIKHTKKGSLVLNYWGRGKGASLSVGGATTWAPAADGKRQTKTVAITSATADIVFSVTSAATAAGSTTAGDRASNSFSATFIPEFAATKCTIAASAIKACTGGGTLSGTSTLSSRRHSISLSLKGAAKDAWFLNVIGADDSKTIKIGSCLLIAGPHWAGFGRTDGNGDGSARFAVSATKAMSAHMQSMTFNFSKSFTLITSNSISIVCK